MNFPKDKKEWIGAITKVGWLFSRLQVIGIIVGAIVTISLQLLTGFWDFRDNHQQIIKAQYEQVIIANARFEEQMLRYNVVFEGRAVVGEDENFAQVAQSYISTLREATRLLPSTKPELERYINALSLLNTYYSESNPPAKGSDEWMKFYGNFRIDNDRYIKAKEIYFSLLASELGNYKRYIINT